MKVYFDTSVLMWRAGHREAILSSKARRIGCGYAKATKGTCAHLWTCVFSGVAK